MSNSIEAIIRLLFDLPEELTWLDNDLLNFPAKLDTFLSSLTTRERTTRTDTDSFFSGSMISGAASIGHFSLIRNSIIEHGAKIGAHVEIANSIVMADTIIPHHNYIGHSIIGRGVRLGGNTR